MGVGRSGRTRRAPIRLLGIQAVAWDHGHACSSEIFPQLCASTFKRLDGRLAGDGCWRVLTTSAGANDCPGACANQAGAGNSWRHVVKAL